ncbi:hypothetical protein MFLAVUS_004010 [Mucor flavus]|uniref:Uncharacterized protein n=1 Tax=Mucor flavus TaxID=439312 RepID=A0ABP9YUP4_9FUNG
MKIDRPSTRARAKQEANDSKEYLKCASYSPVKLEAPSLEISKYESISEADTVVYVTSLLVTESFISATTFVSIKLKRRPLSTLKPFAVTFAMKVTHPEMHIVGIW